MANEQPRDEEQHTNQQTDQTMIKPSNKNKEYNTMTTQENYSERPSGGIKSCLTT